MPSDWWDRHLGVPTTPPPRKAAQWEYNYPTPPPVREEPTPGDSQYQRIQLQGYDTKAPASKGATGTCPGCGGSNFFRRKGPMGVEAAPLCTDCGYNGDYFTQSGTLLNGAGILSSGPTHFARSSNPTGESQFSADQQLVNAGWNPGTVR
jgi:hypothetical protein